MQSEELGDELAQLTVLASNNEGYQNLTLLISAPISVATGRRPDHRSRLAD